MAATKSQRKGREADEGNGPERHEKLDNKTYEHELARLHAELVKLQLWMVAKGLKVCIVFEGRDGAGKGGMIKAITERVSPRVFRVVALPAPTDRETSQMYMQRYVRHFPAAGEIVIFDRSWYNRAGVERVMEFCSMERVKRFLAVAPEMEKAIVEFRHPSHQILARGESGGTDQPARSAHRRPAKDLETVADGSEVLQSLVRLFPRPRRYVQGDRHALGAVACDPFRRQEARAPQRDHASSVADPVRGAAPRKTWLAKEAEAGRLRGTKLPLQVCAGIGLAREIADTSR